MSVDRDAHHEQVTCAEQLARGERVVLYPHIERPQWLALGAFELLTVTCCVILVTRFPQRWLMALVLLGAGLAMVGCLLLIVRLGGRVVLDGDRLRAPNHVRLAASDVALVSSRQLGFGQRCVRVETTDGDWVQLGLGSVRPERVEASVQAIREWARLHGGGHGVVTARPIADGTLLRAGSERAVAALCLVTLSWGGFALRRHSTAPPTWVLLAGVVGTIVVSMFPSWRTQMVAQVRGQRLVVQRLLGYDEVSARSVTRVEQVLDGVRVWRSDAPSVFVRVRRSQRRGLSAELLAWAREHGGGSGEHECRRRPLLWWLLYLLLMLSVGLVLTPGWWALRPHDPGGMAIVATLNAVMQPLLQVWMQRGGQDDSRSASDGR